MRTDDNKTYKKRLFETIFCLACSALGYFGGDYYLTARAEERFRQAALMDRIGASSFELHSAYESYRSVAHVIPEAAYLLGAGWAVDRWQIDTTETQRISRAVNWLKIAADEGYTEAFYALGVLIDKGVYWGEDSIDYYIRAAEEGHARAQYNVAVHWLCVEGESRKADANTLLSTAAESGLVEAQQLLQTLLDQPLTK